MGDKLRPTVEIEKLAARFEQNLAIWLEHFGELLDVGSHDPLEILVEEENQPVAEIWDSLADQERRRILATAGELLDVDLLDVGPKKPARHYHLDGVVGERTEGGAEVDVLNTALPDLEIHVLHYQNPKLGTRYDLVRSLPYYA